MTTPAAQPTTAIKTTTRGTSQLWYPTYRVQVKRSKRHVRPRAYKFISKAQIPLEHYLLYPRTRIQHSTKVASYTITKCPQINCTEAYIGESGRALGDRIKEHLKAPSPIHQHSSSTGHPLSPQCFNIIDQETLGPSRNIKEACFICVNNPLPSRNLGKYQLPHIWDNILQDTLALQVKSPNLPPSPYWYYTPKVPSFTQTPHCQAKVGGTGTLIGKYSNGVPKTPYFLTPHIYAPPLFTSSR